MTAIVSSARRVPEPPDPAPLVSVVIAAYNWSSVLRYSIRSVLRQTYPNLELLVIGDACTDDSAAVVASFGDPRVRWQNLASNCGSQTGPNNRAIELARGGYIAYLGQDDVWHPAHLAWAMHAIEAEDADIVHTLTSMIGPSGSRVRRLAGLSPQIPDTIGEYVPTCSWLHTRELAERIGGWADWRTIDEAPDTEFLDRCRQAGARFAVARALTAYKFASTQRPNSYIEGASHEQAQISARIESQRWFVERELMRLVARRLSPLPERPHQGPFERRGPGGIVEQARQIRGLDANDGPRS